MTPQQFFHASQFPPIFHKALMEGCAKNGAHFLATIAGNMVGPIADKEWAMLKEEMSKPCGMPNCECEKNRSGLFAGLSTIRALYRRAREDREAVAVVGGRAAAIGFNHVAGQYKDGLQFCVNCGGVLCDDRGAMIAEGSAQPCGWAPGTIVAVTGKPGSVHSSAGLNEDLPECL